MRYLCITFLIALTAVFDCSANDVYYWATCYFCGAKHKPLLLV